jgi:hypothetical protein
VNRPFKLRWPACLLAASFLGAAAQDLSTAPPANNWVLPLFTKEGYRQMTIRGDQVRPLSADRVDIKGLNVTVFDGTPEARVDSVILSPQATFLIGRKFAKGEEGVRVVRDDIEVTGEGWSYDYTQKTVLISRKAHVVFRAALPDILK